MIPINISILRQKIGIFCNISLKNAIKLIIELENLFQYAKYNNWEELNSETLKEKMFLLEIELENKLNKESNKIKKDLINKKYYPKIYLY